MSTNTKIPMNRKIVTLLLGAAAMALTEARQCRAADAPLDAETKARVERFEKGPATIDVSKYPQGIQENYEVFSTKCTQCHKLSRPINSDYALPEEWSRYIKRMMHKPGSGISAGDGKKIFDFLAYDSSIRKKKMVDEKLAKATPEEKKAAEDKIKELHDKYDK
jgi:cytochrome c5